jgi:hypothetical protein
MSSKLLVKRRFWLKLYKILKQVALLIFILVELFTVIRVAKESVTESTLCDNSSYMIMQIANSLLLIAFVVFGFCVTKRVNEQ